MRLRSSPRRLRKQAKGRRRGLAFLAGDGSRGKGVDLRCWILACGQEPSHEEVMGPSDNPPRRHHYIPEFWTKRWLGADDLAERYTQPIPGKIVACRKPPSAIGWRKSLYELPHYRGQISNFEVKFFRTVDQRASDIFDKIENKENFRLTRDETIAFSLFIISLLHRTPVAIELLERATKLTISRMLEGLRHRYQEIRSPDDPIRFDEYLENYDDIKKLSHLSTVFTNIIFSKNLSNFISNLHWFRIDLSSAKFPLLLSDDPMIRTDGIAKFDGHLALPINPRLALVGVYDEGFRNEITSQNSTTLAKLMNLQTVESAREFVVAIDKRQDKFIRRRFGLEKRPTLIEQSTLDGSIGDLKTPPLLPPSSQSLGRMHIR